MAGIPTHWIPHRRADGEVVGWIDMQTRAPDLLPIDRLGRALEPVDDWGAAEEVLEERGLGFLQNKFRHRDRTVRIRQLYDDHVVITTALSSAIGDNGEETVLTFPVGTELTEL